jgi:hypothetical protein
MSISQHKKRNIASQAKSLGLLPTQTKEQNMNTEPTVTQSARPASHLPKEGLVPIMSTHCPICYSKEKEMVSVEEMKVFLRRHSFVEAFPNWSSEKITRYASGIHEDCEG